MKPTSGAKVRIFLGAGAARLHVVTFPIHFNLGLSRGGPDLIDDDCHHEKEIETEGPEDQ